MNQTNQQALKFLIGLVILAGVLSSVLIISFNRLNADNSKVIGICLSFIFYGTTGTICRAVTRKPAYNILGIAGVTVSGIAFLFSVIVILGKVESETIFKITFNLMIAAIALAHISFLFHINIQNTAAAIARGIAVVFISLFSLMIIVKVFGDIEQLFYMADASEFYVRSVLAALILDFTATLLVPLCNQLQPAKPIELELTNIAEVPVIPDESQEP